MASLKRWLDRRRNPWKGVFFDAYRKFRAENGQAKLRHYEDLPAGAVVLDIGGFRGEWCDIVLRQQPDCTIHIMEPHPIFAQTLREKYQSDDRVFVHEFGLGMATGTLQLSDEGDASSAIAEHSRSFQAPIVPVASFFKEHNLQEVALAKVNIEGGEYDLLPALIDAGLMPRIARLQVQFHLFEPKLQQARDAILAGLAKSHKQAWCYTFVWEEWQRA